MTPMGHEIWLQVENPTPISEDGEIIRGITDYVGNTTGCSVPLLHKIITWSVERLTQTAGQLWK